MEVFLHAWKAAGFWVLEHVVFVKPYDCSSGYVRRRHEQGYVLGKGRPPLPQVVPPSVIEWKYTKNLLHPTQKPIHILRMFIAAYSRKGDCVLDPFCGSGSTLVAARELDRHSIGIELDGTFAEVAKRRLAQPVGTRD
jgi:site-specific DNA-methyltransferase (adenine-specific)